MNARNNPVPASHSPLHAVAVLAWLGCVSADVTFVGCGSSGDLQRVAVKGKITLDGQPLSEGSILFLPTDGTQGPQAGGVITDGQYQIARGQGPVVGNLRVEIRADQSLAFDITDPEAYAPHVREPLPRNAVPPRYNEQSTLKVATTSDGENQFDFDLQSQPGRTMR